METERGGTTRSDNTVYFIKSKTSWAREATFLLKRDIAKLIMEWKEEGELGKTTPFVLSKVKPVEQEKQLFI